MIDRKTLVLTLQHSKGVPFISEILAGGRPELSFLKDDGKFYVFPKGKDDKKDFIKAQHSGNFLQLGNIDECKWFVKNYHTFKPKPKRATKPKAI